MVFILKFGITYFKIVYMFSAGFSGGPAAKLSTVHIEGLASCRLNAPCTCTPIYGAFPSTLRWLFNWFGPRFSSTYAFCSFVSALVINMTTSGLGVACFSG